MKKIFLMIAASFFTVALLMAAEQQSQPNPFDRYDKDIKKTAIATDKPTDKKSDSKEESNNQ